MPCCREGDAGTLAELVSAVEESRIPVIAAIAGLAYGGGVSEAHLVVGCQSFGLSRDVVTLGCSCW